jgi:hypothetical protein
VALRDFITEQGRSVPMPESSLPIQSALLHLDVETRGRTLVVRFPAGFTREALGHYLAGEEFMVLDGALELMGETFARGDWGWVPPSATRWGFASPEGALVYAWFSQGNEFMGGRGSGGEAATRVAAIDCARELRSQDPILGSSAVVPANSWIMGPAEILEIDSQVWLRVETGTRVKARTLTVARYQGQKDEPVTPN